MMDFIALLQDTQCIPPNIPKINPMAHGNGIDKPLEAFDIAYKQVASDLVTRIKTHIKLNARIVFFPSPSLKHNLSL